MSLNFNCSIFSRDRANLDNLQRYGFVTASASRPGNSVANFAMTLAPIHKINTLLCDLPAAVAKLKVYITRYQVDQS